MPDTQDSTLQETGFKATRNGDALDLYIYDAIWPLGVTAAAVIDALDANKDAKKVHCFVNSPGGSVFEGLAIYNAMVRHPANVVMEVDGLAASAASLVVMAGDERRIAENAAMMIHNPMTCACGTSEDMRKTATMLDMIKQAIVGTYAARSGEDAATIAKMMDEETWFVGQQANDAGFADTVVPAKSNVPQHDVENLYKNAPQTKASQPSSKKPAWADSANSYTPAQIAAIADLCATITNSAAGVPGDATTPTKGSNMPNATPAPAPQEPTNNVTPPVAPVAPINAQPAPQPPAQPQNQSAADAVAEIRAEYARVSKIRNLFNGQYPAVEADAIENGWSFERAEHAKVKAELEDLRAQRPQGPGIHVAPTDINPTAIEAALCVTVGMKEDRVQKHYKPEVMDAANKLRGISLRRLFEDTIRSAGMSPPMMWGNDAIRMAFQASSRITNSTGFTTVSLPGILGNVANKVLLDAYTAYPGIATQLSGEANAPDFKAFSSYRLTMTGEFEEISAAGELKHAGLGEESYSNQLKTRGKMIMLTREMIINDDLGAFLQIPRMLGRQAAEALEKVFFTIFMTNTGNFFHATHKNLTATCPLGVDGLTTAAAKFMNQTDSNGMPVMVRPSILLAPVSLDVQARQLFNDTEITVVVDKPKTADASGSTKKVEMSNPHRGLYRPFSSPWLENSSMTNYSTSTWYLLANPADVPAIQIAYLNGQRTPTIEQGEADFDSLGMGWRAYFDFGVAYQDWRAASKQTA
jgi:ATP-dependent Clp endopeptidase proteolytic subunit ClpP